MSPTHPLRLPAGQAPTTPFAGLAWPSLAEVRQVNYVPRGNVGKLLKLAWRLLKTRPYRARLDALLCRHPHWLPMFADQTASFSPLVQTFVDRRFGVAQRFAHVCNDLAQASHAFGPDSSRRVAQGERVRIWQLPSGSTVDLGVNDINQREGLWALSLRTAQGVKLCQISFSFMRGIGLMIGSVQGAPIDDDAAMQGIRDATREAEGLRPPFLLIEVLRALCLRWNVPLAGIDPRHHVKRIWRHRDLKVSFDYRAFWADLGGHLQGNGVWAIPIQRKPRDLSDVPARRRAMYRRRASLLQALPTQLRSLA